MSPLSSDSDSSVASSSRMTAFERRAAMSLASIFALRMLGLFMITPVFTIYAKSIPGGANDFLVGIAMTGAYGIAQALLYIFYGWISDKAGRKPVIVTGLVVFALGSFVAACAHDITWIIVGRAIQGMGAVSSAVLAFIADLTSEKHRTKAMAMVGGSIGVSFAVAIVGSPVVFHLVGMSGLFTLVGVLSILGIGVVLWLVPDAPRTAHVPAPFAEVLRNVELLRLNFGVLVLHATQVALFLVVPRLLVAAGLPVSSHWLVYLPVMGLSFVAMVPAIVAAEKRGRMKTVLVSAIGLVLIGQLLLGTQSHTILIVAAVLFVYFLGFNVLEASQPSLVSKLAPGVRKGAAMGVYNTTQSIGLALGGFAGGWLLKHGSVQAVFLACSVLVLCWLIIALGMKALPSQRA